MTDVDLFWKHAVFRRLQLKGSLNSSVNPDLVKINMTITDSIFTIITILASKLLITEIFIGWVHTHTHTYIMHSYRVHRYTSNYLNRGKWSEEHKSLLLLHSLWAKALALWLQ